MIILYLPGFTSVEAAKARSHEIAVDSGLLSPNGYWFRWEQIRLTEWALQLNPEEFLLTFLGDIEKESELYETAYTYIRNIDFFDSKHKISSKFGISDHSCITLLNQH